MPTTTHLSRKAAPAPVVEEAAAAAVAAEAEAEAEAEAKVEAEAEAEAGRPTALTARLSSRKVAWATAALALVF